MKKFTSVEIATIRHQISLRQHDEFRGHILDLLDYYEEAEQEFKKSNSQMRELRLKLEQLRGVLKKANRVAEEML